MERTQPVAWRPDGLLRALLVWTSLTTLVFWLPALRGAFDGRSYQWGLGGLSGTGLSGDYWFPVAVAAFTCWLVTCGWRLPGRWFRWLFAAWHAALAIGVVALAVIMGRDLTLQGDTLGITVPLWWVGPSLFGGVACAAAYWAKRDSRPPARLQVAPRERINRPWTAGLSALLTTVFVLLRFGEPHGLSDQIGVVLGAGIWFLLPRALNSWHLVQE